MVPRPNVAIFEFLIPALVLGAAISASAQTPPDSLLPHYVAALLRNDTLAAEEIGRAHV